MVSTFIPNILGFWSITVFKIILVISVLGLTIFVFSFESKEKMLARINKFESQYANNRCRKVFISPTLKFRPEIKRPRYLMLLWLMIVILSCILFITYR